MAGNDKAQAMLDGYWTRSNMAVNDMAPSNVRWLMD